MKKARITIPLTLLAVVLVGWFAAPRVQAHSGTASGTCQGGVSWSYSNYEKADVNSITVTIDGTVRYHDGDFKASDTGTIATDKTVGHTWDVLVNAPGSNFDRSPSGSYGACVTVAPSTTVVQVTTVPITVPDTTVVNEPTTTVTEPTTTTTVVAVDLPPVPCQYNPAVPAGSPLCTPPTTVADISVLVPAEPILPRTGLDGGIVGLAVLLVGVGVVLVVKGRRVR